MSDEKMDLILEQLRLISRDRLWNNSEDFVITISKTITRQFPELPPGDYRWVITISSGDTIEQITRQIKIVPEAVVEPTMLTTFPLLPENIVGLLTNQVIMAVIAVFGMLLMGVWVWEQQVLDRN